MEADNWHYICSLISVSLIQPCITCTSWNSESLQSRLCKCWPFQTRQREINSTLHISHWTIHHAEDSDSLTESGLESEETVCYCQTLPCLAWLSSAFLKLNKRLLAFHVKPFNKLGATDILYCNKSALNVSHKASDSRFGEAWLSHSRHCPYSDQSVWI